MYGRFREKIKEFCYELQKSRIVSDHFVHFRSRFGVFHPLALPKIEL